MRSARRLRRTFESLMLAAAACGAPAACGDTTEASAPDASADATAADSSSADVAIETSAADVADAAPDVTDAALIDCDPWIAQVDATIDHEDVCDYGVPCGLRHHQLTHVGATCQVAPADPDGNAVDAPGFPYCAVKESLGCSDGSYVAPDGGAVVFECIGCFGGAGRRPAGLLRAHGSAPSALGAWLAEVAFMEEASIAAFERLARELSEHGAPSSLVRAARASARDEARHTRAMSKLAARFGATPARARVRSPRTRTLAAIARENAVEGCARETYGALVASWQAAHAGDEEMRCALERIARDEIRHAALSWKIAAWIDTRLSRAQVRSVRRARDRAAAETSLAANARDLALSVRERAAIGLPDAACARRLARGLAVEIAAA